MRIFDLFWCHFHRCWDAGVEVAIIRVREIRAVALCLSLLQCLSLPRLEVCLETAEVFDTVVEVLFKTVELALV